MDFKSNPLIQKTMRKAGLILALVIMLEVGLMVLLSMQIGFPYVFWITVGFILLGYAIRPSRNVSQKRMSEPFSPRRFASTFFMIPGFLTDIVAILVLIPPVRRFLFNKLLNKFLPNISNMINPFGAAGMGTNPLGGMDFSQFSNMGMGMQQDEQPFQAKKKRTRKKRQHTEDIIDIEPEYTSKDTIKAEVVRNKKESHAPKALPSDIIDV